MSRLNSQAEVGLSAELTAEDRAAMNVATASRNERVNRPAWAVAVAAAILVVAAISLFLAFNAKDAAEDMLRREQGQAAHYVELAAKYKKLQSDAAAPGIKTNTPMGEIRSTIVNAATRAGLASASTVFPTSVESDNKTAVSGRTKLIYNSVKDASLEALLSWLKYATEDVPGLEVYSVTIKPEASAWNMRVIFTRWERTGS